MNIVENYYIRKAQIHKSDDFYERIDEGDLELLRRAWLYLLIAPAGSIVVCYLLKELRHSLMMSQNFSYVIKRAQDRFKYKYKKQSRDSNQENSSPSQSDSANNNSYDSQNLTSLYQQLEVEKQKEK